MRQDPIATGTWICGGEEVRCVFGGARRERGKGSPPPKGLSREALKVLYSSTLVPQSTSKFSDI